MKCPRCQHENADVAKFCGECGTRLETVCPASQAANPPSPSSCRGAEEATLREIVADLIIHKALAGRPQDVLDLEGVVARQGVALDVAYVRRWLEELTRLADDPEVAARFQRVWARYGPRR